MAQIGAEIDQMGVLVSTFNAKSAEVQELTSAIDTQVGGTWWVGPASERFRGEWDGQFKPSLAKLQEALSEAAAEVNRRMNALQSAGS